MKDIELFDELFNTYFGIKPYRSYSYNPVKVDNVEDKSIIKVDVPGYKKSDIVVDVEEDKLNIKLDGNRGKKQYRFKLTDADLDNITSKLEDGILEIVVVSKKTNKKTIEIK
jgi:HSP20 family molecular chaperone IbpA